MLNCYGKVTRVGLARTIYIRCMYGVFGREINKYTVIYGVYIRFWPTLVTCYRRGEGSIGMDSSSSLSLCAKENFTYI